MTSPEPKLRAQVVGDDIIVTLPGSHYSVTYYKPEKSPQLLAKRIPDTDKMSARCQALSIASGDKKYIDGACVLADSDGDKIFSTFDTRDLDKLQPDMNCGTHSITGGTGKYAGITGVSRLLAFDARTSR
jgi:hypothetical protein